jgi:transcriptional regulator with XRE-family HTH domain
MELSQDQLAELSGVSRATIVQLESGSGDPRLSTLAAIAGALGISPMLLLLGSDELLAIANVAESAEAEKMREHLSKETLEDMQRLLRSGLQKNRSKAIAMGIAAAITNGPLTGLIRGLVPGIAIGSSLLPGVGTIIGAALGAALYKSLTKKESD